MSVKLVNNAKNISHMKMSFSDVKKQKYCLKNFHFIMLQLENHTLNVLIT